MSSSQQIHGHADHTSGAHVPASIQDAVYALRQGHAVVFPTDTVYGIGVGVAYAQTPEEIYRIKERSYTKPIAWLVDGPRALTTYGTNVPDSVIALARRYWPGPLTIIVKASHAVPHAYQSSDGTIGLRAPKSKTVQQLIAEVGCPLATSSANITGDPSPYSFCDINPRLLDRVACGISDATEKSGIASTVIDCSGAHVIMVRKGAISLDEIHHYCS